MNVVRRMMVLLFAAGAMASCGEGYDKLDQDRKTIETFLNGKLGEYADYDVIGNVYRYVLNADREEYAQERVAEKGDVVEFYYEAYAFTSALVLDSLNYSPSLIFATNRPRTLDFLCDQEKMGSLPAWTRNFPGEPEEPVRPEDPVEARVGSTELVKGVKLGLPGARQGDQMWLIFASDLGFGEKELGTVPKNQILAYRIYMEKVTKR